MLSRVKMLMRAATVPLCKGQGAVDSHDRVAELLPGERVSWPALPPEPAPITMLSRGILGGDGDRPELAAASSNDDGAVGGGG